MRLAGKTCAFANTRKLVRSRHELPAPLEGVEGRRLRKSRSAYIGHASPVRNSVAMDSHRGGYRPRHCGGTGLRPDALAFRFEQMATRLSVATIYSDPPRSYR